MYRYVAGVRLRTTARERCDGALPGLIPHTPSLWGIGCGRRADTCRPERIPYLPMIKPGRGNAVKQETMTGSPRWDNDGLAAAELVGRLRGVGAPWVAGGGLALEFGRTCNRICNHSSVNCPGGTAREAGRAPPVLTHRRRCMTGAPCPLQRQGLGLARSTDGRIARRRWDDQVKVCTGATCCAHSSPPSRFPGREILRRARRGRRRAGPSPLALQRPG